MDLVRTSNSGNRRKKNSVAHTRNREPALADLDVVLLAREGVATSLHYAAEGVGGRSHWCRLLRERSSTVRNLFAEPGSSGLFSLRGGAPPRRAAQKIPSTLSSHLTLSTLATAIFGSYPSARKDDDGIPRPPGAHLSGGWPCRGVEIPGVRRVGRLEVEESEGKALICLNL